MSSDYLSEDTINPSNQKYVCLSFLVEEGKTLSGIKVRGSFETYDEACLHAKKLQAVDESFNVFVGEVGKWLPFNPDPDSIKDFEYANNELNEMMKGYAANQERAKLFHEQRKNEMIQKSINDNIENRMTNLNEIESDLKKEQNPNEIIRLESNMKATKEQLEDLKKKKEDLSTQLELIKNKLKLYNSI
jgi:hypothetical protein